MTLNAAVSKLQIKVYAERTFGNDVLLFLNELSLREALLSEEVPFFLRKPIHRLLRRKCA